MVGTLMYLTASRPYLTFVVCIVPAYADADHTGCQDTRRSTSGNRLKFEKCNMRLKTDIKPKEATFQICPKIPGQRFEEPPLEHDILSFLRDLGHTRAIHYIIDVSIDYLHQLWRAFATIINKCLSGKDTAYEKILHSLQTYYAYATVERRPQKKRLKNFQKKASPTHLPKKKTAPCYKVKLATRKHEDFHMSQPSGSGDGVDIQLKLLDEQQQKIMTEYDFTHPSLLTYKADDQEEKDKKADNKEVFSNQSMSTPPDYELTDEEENKEGDYMYKKGIVDNYLASKMKEALDVVVQLQSNKLREEAQAENKNSSINHTKKRDNDQKDKNEEPSVDQPRVERRKSQPKSSSKSAHAEEHGQKVDDLEDQPHQEFNTGNDDVTPERKAQDDVVF
ncbi:hypothetical protein Tco_0876947 [Tanacetum coccineum]|uniref:Uncharacterized protein n=1 Tax=Tanacetum coccineum TaxID=301880 RepID=A0ABQ5BWG3_9ASTR